MTTKIIADAIKEELENARKNHGESFHSDHEAHSVLQAELEEAQKALDNAKEAFNKAWHGIRKNEDNFKNIIHIRESAFNAAAEAIQICAVIDKWLESGKIKSWKNISKLPLKKATKD